MSVALGLLPQVFQGCRAADAGAQSFRPSAVIMNPRRHACRCEAVSLGGRRENPDFSRRPRHRGEGSGWGGGEREIPESLALSNSPHYRSTLLPGPREREILELFRKVQVRLRERKTDNRAEAVPPKPRGSGTVGSLLEVLRRHADSRHQPPAARSSPQVDDGPTSKGEEDLPEYDYGQLSSNADVDSPQLASARDVTDDIGYGSGSPGMDAYDDGDDDDDDEMEMYDGVDDVGDDGDSDDDESDDVAAEENDDGGDDCDEREEDLESMTIVQLRGLAKLRGLRGFSRMKKDDLVQIIRGSS